LAAWDDIRQVSEVHTNRTASKARVDGPCDDGLHGSPEVRMHRNPVTGERALAVLVYNWNFQVD